VSEEFNPASTSELESRGLLNPFKGLAYFDNNPQDQQRFGGRDSDIQLVTNEILKSRTFVIYGRSGLGKTSLLLAGIFPELLIHGCVPVLVRTLENPLEDLQSALMKAAGVSEPMDNVQLIRAISEANEQRMVVIVFDQFEEFFIRFSEEAAGDEEDDEAKRVRKVKRKELRRIRDRFIEESGRLANDPELNLRLVWSLREDWVAEMRGFSHVVADITDDAHRLLPLTAFGVRHSILSLVEAAGVTLDSSLLSELINTLSDYDFDPAVLQVICSEVWKQAADGGSPQHLKHEHFEAIGGVTGVFNKYLNTVTREISDLGRSTRIQVRAVLNALITDKRTKRALKFGQLLKQGFVITEQELRNILTLLHRNQLVRHDRRSGEDWYELVHERLVEIILGWLGDDPDYFEFRAARNLVRNNCRNPGWEDDPELLLSGAQLEKVVGPNKELLSFSDREKNFLLGSAIYANAADIEFWTTLVPGEVAIREIDSFLDQPENTKARAQAGRCAGNAGIGREHFATRCLKLALEDPDSVVREACAASFARLADGGQIPPLKEALKDKQRKKNATRVLAAMIAADNLPGEESPGRRNLSRARKLLLKERLLEFRDIARKRSRTGALTGLIAAVIWTVTAGLLGINIGVRELDPQDALSRSFIFGFSILGAFFASSLALAPLFGWLVARRATRNALLSKSDGGAFRAVMGPKLAGVLVAALLMAILIPDDVMRDIFASSDAKFGAIVVCSALLLLLAWVAAVTRFAQPILQARSSRSIWLRAWPWAFGGSLLLPIITWALFDHLISRVSNFGPELLFLAFMIILFCMIFVGFGGGLLIYTSLLALARTSPSWNLDLQRDFGLDQPYSQPPRARAPMRWLGVALSVAVMGILVQANGIDALIDKNRVLESEAVTLEPVFHSNESNLDHDHFSLTIRPINRQAADKTNQPRLLHVVNHPDMRVYHEAGWEDPDRSYYEQDAERFVVAKPGIHRMAFRGSSSRNGEFAMRITPDDYPTDAPDDPPLEAGRDHLFVVPLRSNGNGTMTGHLDRALDLPDGQQHIDLALASTTFGSNACQGEVWWLSPMEDSPESLAERSLTCEPGRTVLDLHANSNRHPVQGNRLELDFNLKRLGRVRYLRHSLRVSSAQFHPDPKRVPIVQQQRTFRQETKPEGVHRDTVLTGSDDGQVRVWIGDESRQLGWHDDSVNYAMFNDDGTLVVSAAANGLVKVWDYREFAQRSVQDYYYYGGQESIRRLPHFNEASVWGVDISTDNDRVVSVTAAGDVYFWDLEQGDLTRSPVRLQPNPDETNTLYKVAYNHDDSLVAVASAQGIFLLDAFSGEVLGKRMPGGASYAVQFSNDGEQVLTATGNEVLLWQTSDLLKKTGEAMQNRGDESPLEPEEALAEPEPVRLVAKCPVYFATFNVENDRIAAGCQDGSIHIWFRKGDSSFVKEERVFIHGPRAAGSKDLWGVAFSPDGQKLLSASVDANAGIWDIPQAAKETQGKEQNREMYLFVRARLTESEPAELDTQEP
jgi:WD40 repeat protein